MDIKYNEWKNKNARISLENGRYYKGFVLDVDDIFIKLRDFKGDIVFIRWDTITVVEGWSG